MKGHIHSIESFALVDGPGSRCAVFLKGCALRCRYCHNPDTWGAEGGTDWEAKDLIARVLRFRPYWGENGGLTVTGGEPLLQIDFLIEFFQLAKAEGIHTCIDTAGQPFDSSDPAWMEKFARLMEVTDLVMLDIKEIDDEKHIALTGKTNKNILEMARWLSEHGKHMWIRHVLVPNLTDDEAGLIQTRDFINSLKTVDLVEILPYHDLGKMKYEKLGIPYSLEGVESPTREQKLHAEEILECAKYRK